MGAGQKIGTYRDLVAWQKALDLAEAVYRATEDWPRREHYGLSDQVRRAAASVPANIAEGHGRTGTKEFLHHLSIAVGSLHEAETYLILAQRLRYLDDQIGQSLLHQAAEIGRLIGGLIRSLRPRPSP